jgi:predicted enzyme related to lactoylglutathione lyase
MAHTIVHFEMPSDNIERAKKFYNNLFGWKAEKIVRSQGVLDIFTTPQHTLLCE